MTVENPGNRSPFEHAKACTTPDKDQGLFRRTGSKVLDAMFIAPGERTDIDVDDLVRNENETIDMRKIAHRVNLFRQKSLDGDLEHRARLMAQFESELSERHTISERFDLFMDERYADEVYTLDLGETLEAGSHDAVEAIKDEFRILEQRLIEEDVITGEIPRDIAMPTVHFGKSQHDEYCLGTRNRNLFSFTRDDRVITVAKRMTFLMTSGTIPDALHHKPDSQYVVDIAQKLIDSQDPAIIPVRTVYYATNKSLEDK